MKVIVDRIGWPTISKVGDDASYEAWLLVQHSPDIEFQKKCLTLMQQEPVGEVNSQNRALLEDRILAREGKSQIYGTQSKKEGGNVVLFPIENPEKVNELRKEIGLEPLEGYGEEV